MNKLVTVAMSRRLHQQPIGLYIWGECKQRESRRHESDLMHFGLRQNDDNRKFCIRLAVCQVSNSERFFHCRVSNQLKALDRRTKWVYFRWFAVFVLGHESQLKAQICRLMGSLTLHHLANCGGEASGSDASRRLINDHHRNANYTLMCRSWKSWVRFNLAFYRNEFGLVWLRRNCLDTVMLDIERNVSSPVPPTNSVVIVVAVAVAVTNYISLIDCAAALVPLFLVTFFFLLFSVRFHSI